MPDLRLDSFELDESNKFAIALCKAVVQLEKGYSPLFIHGERGSGKTHLLTAIKNELAQAHPEMSLLYISSDFPLEKAFPGAQTDGSNGGAQEFIYKTYNRMDVLIADDIERFRKDPETRHRFYALFDTFVDNEKQIVLASTLPIERLDGFNQRFLSRLRGGIDALVSLPRPETLFKILKRECERAGIRLDVEILKLLMLEAGGDVPYLKKLPSHLKTFSTLTRNQLTKEKVEEFLSVIREEAGEDKSSATTEQIYNSWMQSKSGVRERDLNEKIRQIERDLAEKDSRLLKLDQKLKETLEQLAESADARKQSEESAERLKKELEQLKKDSDDELLSLRIQLEDKGNKFELLREEREARISEQTKEAKGLREQAEEIRTENLLLDNTVEDLNERVNELTAQLKAKSADLAKVAAQLDSADKERGKLAEELDGVLRKLEIESGKHTTVAREKVEQERRLLAEIETREKELSRIRADAEKQAAELQARIKQSNKEREQSEKRASDLAAAIEIETRKRQKLEDDVASISSALEELKASSANECAELRRLISEKESALADSSALEIRLRSEIGELQKSLDSERSRLSASEQNAKKHSDRTAALESDLKSTKADLDKNRAECASLNRQMSELRSDRGALEQRANALAEEVALLTKTVSDREELLAAKEKEAAGFIKNLQDELKKRTDEFQRLEADIKSRESELKSQHTEKKSLVAEIERLCKDISSLKEEKDQAVARLSSEVEKSSKQVGAAEKKIGDLQKKLEEVEARSSEAAAELGKAREDFSRRLEREKAAQAEREKAFSEEKTSLDAKFREATLGAKALKAEVARLEDKVRQQEQLLAAREKGESEHIAKLKEELRRREDEFEKLSREAQSKNRELDASSAHVAQLTEKLSALEVSLSALTEEKRKTEEIVSEANRKLSASEGGLASAQASLNRSEARVANLMAQLASERATFAETTERERTDWMKKEQALRQANSAGESELRAAAGKIAEVEEAAAAARQHEQTLKQAQEQLSRLGRLVEEKECRIGELQKTIEAMRADFLRQTAEGTEVKERFSSLEADLSAREKTLASARKEYAEFQSAQEKMIAEMESAKAQSASLASERTTVEKEAASLRERILFLETRLSELESERTRSQDGLRARIQELEQLAANKEKTVEDSETQLRDTLHAALASKDQEISDLKCEHKKIMDLIKEDVKNAAREFAVSREAFHEELEREREMSAGLKNKLARMESEIEKLMTGKAAAQTSEASTAEAQPAKQPLKEEPVAAHGSGARPSQIQWLHTFEEFKTLETIAFSVSVTEKIARNPGELYNPLFVYGPKGCGKTHILHAIGDLATSEDPELTCEFTSLARLLDTMPTNPETVEDRLNSLRLLLIDDFEVIHVQPDMQLRLYEFLKALVEKNAQIVIAAMEPPIRIGGMQGYLLRFIESGLLAKLEIHPEIIVEEQSPVEVAPETVAEAPPAPKESTEVKQAEPSSPAKAGRDFLDELLAPDPALTSANFRGNQVFEDFEEAFGNPNKKWRNKFPLLVIEDDDQRRNHFFNALAHRLRGMFTGRVSLLSVSKLADALALTSSFDWSGLLNRLAKSHVILIDDCDSVQKLPASASSYLSAIIEEITGRDILMMIGLSKRYKKEPLFGNVYKKATRKKL